MVSSKFGWLVSGNLAPSGNSLKKFTGFTLKTIENNLKDYHGMEQTGVIDLEPQKETDSCVQHYEDTYGFSDDGKFNLRLPFRVEKSKIANNRELAWKSLFRLEQTLDPVLKIEYEKFTRESTAMGHMSLVERTTEPCYYIPHRAVVREESSTTAVRVVFNASSKSKGEISLNDGLMVGPQIQRELFDILISVRSYCYVFSADGRENVPSPNYAGGVWSKFDIQRSHLETLPG